MTLRVLHYVDSSRPGGIETHLLQLLPAQQAAGMAPGLVLHRRHGPHPMVDGLVAAGVPVADLGGRIGRLPARLRTPGTVLHTHGYKAGILGRAVARALGVPVVSTMHSGDLGQGRVRLWNGIDRLTAPLARQVVVSPAQLARHPGASLVPNGIALPEGAPLPGRGVAFVGRMAAEKGPLDFARLARALPDLPFLAFGDGPLRPRMEADAAGRVTFRGAVPDMGPHWHEIGLLVMPSVFEGLPMAALEAMARGIPVAAYAVGGLPDLLDGCGFLVPPGDTGALGRAIAAWAAEEGADRALRRRRCHERVAERHDIRQGVAALRAVYEAALGRGPAAADGRGAALSGRCGADPAGTV